MTKTRILIIDDDATFRRRLGAALVAAPEFEVVDAIANDRSALLRTREISPDVVLLGLGKPQMSGLVTLTALRKKHGRLPIVLLIQPVDQGSPSTLEALALGASDFVLVPDGDPAAWESEGVSEPLLSKLRLFHRPARGAVKPAPLTCRPSNVGSQLVPPIEVVAIGASTGGPHALRTVLSALRTDLPVPVVVVQHMPPQFTRLLADQLGSQTGLTVREAQGGEVPRPGEVWLAPGDQHLVLTSHGTTVRLVTHQGPPENSCRPAVDVLLRSAAEVFRAGVLAVILTGMGRDGLRGCEQVRAAGGQIVVQDEASSVVWGMPGFVARAGLANKVLALEGIGAEIDHRVRRGALRSSPEARTAASHEERTPCR